MLIAIVLTPMDTEEKAARKALRRAGLQERVRLHRSGIGRERVLAALDHVLQPHAHEPGAPRVILFGVGGGLCPGPVAPRLTHIVNESGDAWPCTLVPPARENAEPGARAVGVDRLVPGSAAKLALHRATGACVVDMESHAFAARASALGVPFGVVRGVSDGPDHELPPQTLDWVHPDGRSRPGRFVRDVALRPWLIPGVARTIPQVFRGLREGAQRLTELIHTLAPAEARA